MAECRLVIIKRNGEDLNEQLLAPGTEWKIGKGVNADIRVRIDGVEENHGIIKVDKDGKVRVRNFSAVNPLMVNGKPFPKEQVISNGDHLSIMNRSFRFDIKEPVLQQVTGNALQLTSTPDQVSGKSILLQSGISGIENYRSSPRPGRSRRSTPGTVGASRIATPIPSESLYKSWRSSLSVNSSSLDKIQEDGEGTDGGNAVSDVQQCLFAEEKAEASDGAPANKPRRSTRRSSIRRSVVFGPALSPEYFDKSLPPNTPLRKGTLPPSSFIGDQPPNELGQIVEEEEAQNSYSELFSTPAKTKRSPSPKKTKAKSPKQSVQERRKSGTKKVASPVKGNKIRKSYGGVAKKSTKQKRSSLPASMKQINSSGLIDVPAGKMKLSEDSTDGAALVKLRQKDGKEVHTPKTKKTMKDESAKKHSLIKKKDQSKSATFSTANRSFAIGDSKRASKNRRSLPSSVLMEGASDTSLVPYIPVSPTDDIPALPEEQSFEVSTEETEEETETRLSLPTPLKKSIRGGVSLKRTKPKLWTPLRKDLETGVVLRKLHQALPTPIREAIASNPILRATKKALATPIRNEIEGQPKLHATKKALATPIRKAIEGQPKLRATKKALATPIRQEIEGQPKLRATKKALATPVRKEIEGQPKLRATKKALATPIRQEIEGQPKLRATKKALATPIRQEIEGQPKLRATKKALATPIRQEIEGQPKLRATKKALATPIRKEIEGQPKLRATKKALATPIRQEIEGQPKLRATKKALATPIRKEIEGQPKLRATKKALATPIRKEIEGQPKLRATKKALATPIRKEIEGQPKLRATKKALATPIRKEIEGQPKLRVTKKRMATPLRRDIESKPKLRTVMKSLPTPLKTDIKKKRSLRQTKRRMATPLQESIKGRPTLRKVMKSLPTPMRQEIESQPTLRQTKKMLPLPVREEILKRPTLKPTRRRMATPLRQAIENAPPLKATKKNEIVPPTERRAPKRRQSKGEDDLPPTKKAKAVVAPPPVEYGGLQRLFKETTKTRRGTPQGDAVFQGIERMFRTPKSRKDLSPDYEGLVDLFSSPIVSTMVTTKKVKFMSPVAMSAKRSTRSTATMASNTMVLNVPKLNYSENANAQHTRSKEASIPLTLEDPLPTSELKKTSQKRTRSRAQKSTEYSAVPEPENNTVSTAATRSLRSGKKSVNEVAPVAAKRKGTSKKKIEAENETKEAPVAVITRRRTRASEPAESPTVSPIKRTRRRTRASEPADSPTVSPIKQTRQSKAKNSPVRRTRKTKAINQEVTTVEVKTTTTRKRKTQVVENNVENTGPVVRRTRKSQLAEQEVTATAEAPVSTRKRKAPLKPAENNAESVSISPVVRKTRGRMAKEQVTAVESGTITKKRKTSQKIADSIVENVSASPVVRRTRRSQMTKQVSVSMSVEPKKVVVTKRTMQEVKESDVSNEAVSPAVTRTRQNQIIKVIVPVNAIRQSARLHRE